MLKHREIIIHPDLVNLLNCISTMISNCKEPQLLIICLKNVGSLSLIKEKGIFIYSTNSYKDSITYNCLICNPIVNYMNIYAKVVVTFNPKIN